MKDIENPTRRGFLTTVSAVGLNLAIEAIPAVAQPASERPKEGDLLVSIESESTNALEPKDIPLGGPPLLAWPIDAADKTVRKDSRLNKILLLRLDPSTLVGATKDRADQRRRRSEEHTSELQSQFHLVCRLLLEKKKTIGEALVYVVLLCVISTVILFSLV